MKLPGLAQARQRELNQSGYAREIPWLGAWGRKPQ